MKHKVKIIILSALGVALEVEKEMEAAEQKMNAA